LARYAAQLQGIAITVVENRIMIYDIKGVAKLPVPDRTLMETFLKGFRAEERELGGDCVAALETENKTTRSSLVGEAM
jgi:hypothetical protein